MGFNSARKVLKRLYTTTKNLTLAAMLIAMMITDIATGVMSSESRPGRPPLMPQQLTLFVVFTPDERREEHEVLVPAVRLWQ